MIHRAHKSREQAIGNHETAQSLGTYRLPSQFPTPDFLGRIRPGMVELLTSFDCAKSVKSDVWNFAVEISILRTAGLGDNEFRWLVFMKYVDHAQEVTRPKDDGRQFRQTGNLSFTRRTCFVLTKVGELFARTVLRQVPAPTSTSRITENDDPKHGNGKNAADQSVPAWDAQRRELRMNGRVIKRFRWSAKNQERILATFEEEGWLYRIDDPIPPQSNADQKQRLRDAVRALNKNHEASLIRFRGDGTGQGVVWELVEEAADR
jgi:hypothetical protein